MRLTAATTPASALLHNRGPLATGIVHLGLGNFHRAHQAVHTAVALAAEDGPWGILGVANRSATVVDALREQDLRYAVLTVAPQESRASVPAVHTGALVAAHDPDAVVAAIAAPGTAMVTLTVTEHGYHFSSRTDGLDLDDPAIRADVRGAAPPVTPIGLVARGLQRRARTHGAPITVLSCDNLASNGDTTARLLHDFAAALPAAEAAELLDWLARSVAFPNSMVDRIVPATTDADRATAARLLGVRDAVPVPAEPFTMWVLQDRFAAGRPRWERSGAVFTDDVEPYEVLKLRLLNGTHSLIAYLGALAGAATIPEAIGNTFVAEAAQHAISDYLPTVEVPADVDLDAYVGALFARWANTALGHGTHQVGSDGSGKLRQRIPDPAVARLAAGHLPHLLALTVAAYLSCIAPPAGFDPGPHAAVMVDPARQRLAAARAGAVSTAAFVDAVLDTGLLGSELVRYPEFAARVAELADVITRFGSAAAAADAMHARTTA